MIGKMTGKIIGRGWLLILPPLLVLGGCAPPIYGPSQNIPGSSAVRGTNNGGALNALAQLTELKEELKKLRNSVEELEFDTENTRRRQQNENQDLDRRLLGLERAIRLLLPSQVGGGFDGGLGAIPGLIPGLIPGTPGPLDDDAETAGDADVAVVGGGAGTRSETDTTPAIIPSGDGAEPTGSVSVPEQQAYEAAFNLLKQSKYQDAIDGFQKLIDAWPQSQLTDDAYYWMSEARYVNREFETALAGFRTVTTRYPDSPKVPEALLRTGYIQHDIGAYAEAAEIFRDLLERFPGHQVAVAAQTRLRRIEQIIQ